MRAVVFTIVSGSLEFIRTGIALRFANSAKMAAFPSITGNDASGPILPRPSTAVPSVTMAMRSHIPVYSYAASGVSSMTLQTDATPGV